MVEYSTGKKEFREDRINIFHFNDQTQLYKTLAINPTDENDAVFYTIRTGVKGQKGQSLSLKLDKKEVAFLILELQKLYNGLK